MVTTILFVCTGNACRSPMAQVVMGEMLREKDLSKEITVNSAGLSPAFDSATEGARQVILSRYGKDLLGEHMPTGLDEVNLNEFDLILAMEETHKESLMDLASEQLNIHTLREFAGEQGDVDDPYVHGDYERTLKELESLLTIVLRIIVDTVHPRPETMI